MYGSYARMLLYCLYEYCTDNCTLTNVYLATYRYISFNWTFIRYSLYLCVFYEKYIVSKYDRYRYTLQSRGYRSFMVLTFKGLFKG